MSSRAEWEGERTAHDAHGLRRKARLGVIKHTTLTSGEVGENVRQAEAVRCALSPPLRVRRLRGTSDESWKPCMNGFETGRPHKCTACAQAICTVAHGCGFGIISRKIYEQASHRRVLAGCAGTCPKCQCLDHRKLRMIGPLQSLRTARRDSQQHGTHVVLLSSSSPRVAPSTSVLHHSMSCRSLAGPRLRSEPGVLFFQRHCTRALGPEFTDRCAEVVPPAIAGRRVMQITACRLA